MNAYLHSHWRSPCSIRVFLWLLLVIVQSLHYFIVYTFWQAKALAEPFDYTEYREQRKREMLEKELAGERITVSYSHLWLFIFVYVWVYLYTCLALISMYSKKFSLVTKEITIYKDFWSCMLKFSKALYYLHMLCLHPLSGEDGF